MPEDGKRRICVVLVDRANYGRLRPVMRAVHDHPDLELQVLVAGTMVLERFDRTEQIVETDGFPISGRLHTELEGSNPTTMAKSVGFGVIEFSSELARLKPDLLLIIGDRYEALSAVLAAAFMNVPIAHVQGGEVSGSIDESTRHAITKYSQYHFPATKRAAEFIIRMGEKPSSILAVGCPSADIASEVSVNGSIGFVNEQGTGAELDPSEPFILAVFHPTTTRFGRESDEMWELLRALSRIRRQTLLLWPNIDAGSDHISKQIRRFQNTEDDSWLRVITNLTPEQYLITLARASCAVGNSSSFVRDSTFFGTPIVLVGERQQGREVGENLEQCAPTAIDIEAAVKSQLARGQYPPSTLYGRPGISAEIAEQLAHVDLYVQKRLAYEELT